MVVMFFAACYRQHEQENVCPAAHFVDINRKFHTKSTDHWGTMEPIKQNFDQYN